MGIERQLARDAIQSFGSIDVYTDEMISNLGHLTEVVDELMRTGTEQLKEVQS